MLQLEQQRKHLSDRSNNTEMIDALQNLKIQIATPENTGTERLPSIMEALESLEEIKDGRANNMDMKQVIHTLMDETPKEEKNRDL